MRSAEYPATGSRVIVNNALQIGEQVGDTLYLVEDGALRELRQKGLGVVCRKYSFVQSFEVYVRMFGKDRLA